MPFTRPHPGPPLSSARGCLGHCSSKVLVEVWRSEALNRSPSLQESDRKVGTSKISKDEDANWKSRLIKLKSWQKLEASSLYGEISALLQNMPRPLGPHDDCGRGLLRVSLLSKHQLLNAIEVNCDGLAAITFCTNRSLANNGSPSHHRPLHPLRRLRCPRRRLHRHN